MIKHQRPDASSTKDVNTKVVVSKGGSSHFTIAGEASAVVAIERNNRFVMHIKKGKLPKTESTKTVKCARQNSHLQNMVSSKNPSSLWTRFYF